MVEPFLNLKGKSSEAIIFYENIFGGVDKKVMAFSDMPTDPNHPIPEHMKTWIAHAEMSIRGTVFHFSDTQPDALANGMISLMLRFDTVDELMEMYHKLIDGGVALMEPEPQFYAKLFGWVRDKFDIDWQLICE